MSYLIPRLTEVSFDSAELAAGDCLDRIMHFQIIVLVQGIYKWRLSTYSPLWCLYLQLKTPVIFSELLLSCHCPTKAAQFLLVITLALPTH